MQAPPYSQAPHQNAPVNPPPPAFLNYDPSILYRWDPISRSWSSRSSEIGKRKRTATFIARTFSRRAHKRAPSYEFQNAQPPYEYYTQAQPPSTIHARVSVSSTTNSPSTTPNITHPQPTPSPAADHQPRFVPVRKQSTTPSTVVVPTTTPLNTGPQTPIMTARVEPYGIENAQPDLVRRKKARRKRIKFAIIIIVIILVSVLAGVVGWVIGYRHRR